MSCIGDVVNHNLVAGMADVCPTTHRFIQVFGPFLRNVELTKSVQILYKVRSISMYTFL